MLIRKGDTVQIITGADRGTRAQVVSVNPTAGKLVVEGVNRVYKHVKRSQKHPQGGRLNIEMPVQLSNVQFVDSTTDKPTRLGVRYLEDGSKERYCKGSGVSAGQIAPAKAAYAKK